MDSKRLLPLVHPDIQQAISAEMLAKPRNDYVLEILKRLERENPEVASFLYTFAASRSTPQEAMSVLYAGAIVYRLMESQAEADQMEAQTKEEPSE